MTNLKKLSTDKNENTITDWYTLEGQDFGTDFIFDSVTYGVIWTANQYQIVDEENTPLTEGDFEWIAVKNTFTAHQILTSSI